MRGNRERVVGGGRESRDGLGLGFGMGGSTVEEIGVEMGGVLAEPGLALVEVGAELAVLGGEAADAAVEDAHRLRLLRHGGGERLLPTAFFFPFGFAEN